MLKKTLAFSFAFESGKAPKFFSLCVSIKTQQESFGEGHPMHCVSDSSSLSPPANGWKEWSIPQPCGFLVLSSRSEQEKTQGKSLSFNHSGSDSR